MSKPSHQHPLARFDNERFCVTMRDGQKLFVRLLTSHKSATESPELSELLGPIAFQTQERLRENLNKKRASGSPEITSDWFEDKRSAPKDLAWWTEEFTGGNPRHYTAMALEDEAGSPFSAMAFTINDQDKRGCVRADNDVPFIFFDLSQTKEEYSGKGYLKLMRSFLLPHFLAEAGIDGKAYMANSMKRMCVTDPTTKTVIHEGMPNFVIHSKIFRSISDEEVEVLQRWRGFGKTKDFSFEESEALPISSFFRGSNLNEEAVRQWIMSAKASHPDKKLEGCFMRATVQNMCELTAKTAKKLDVRIETEEEQIHRKTMEDLDEKLGIGEHQHTPGHQAIRKVWAAKASPVIGQRY